MQQSTTSLFLDGPPGRSLVVGCLPIDHRLQVNFNDPDISNPNEIPTNRWWNLPSSRSGNRREEPTAHKLREHMKVSRLWFCTRCRQHRVDLTSMVGLVIEELNSTERLWLLDPS